MVDVVAQRLLVSQVTVWLGHNSSLEAGFSDEAISNLVALLAPYLLYLDAASLRTQVVPGSESRRVDQLTGPDAGTPLEGFPLLDNTGLAELMGRACVSDPEYAQTHWMAALDVETSAAVALADQDVVALFNLQVAYSYAFGYVTGAQSKIVVDDAQALADTVARWVDLGGLAVGTAARVASDGSAAGAVLASVINAGAKQLSGVLAQQVAAGAYDVQRHDAEAVEDTVVARWNQYMTDSNAKLDEQNARSEAGNGFANVAGRTMHDILG